MRVLPRLVRASTVAHDEPRFRADLAETLPLLLNRLPREPALSPRLRRLAENPVSLKPMDADNLVDAIAEVIGWTGHPLSDDLLNVTLLVARLGGVSAAVRIGRLERNPSERNRGSCPTRG